MVLSCNANNYEDRLIYSVPLHIPGYDTDNRDVWHKIQNYCIGTTSYNWIREFEANKDGRFVWTALLQQYERTDS